MRLLLINLSEVPVNLWLFVIETLQSHPFNPTPGTSFNPQYNGLCAKRLWFCDNYGSRPTWILDIRFIVAISVTVISSRPK